MLKNKKLITGLFLTAIFILAIPLNSKASVMPEIMETRAYNNKADDDDSSKKPYNKIPYIPKKVSDMKFLSDDEKAIIAKDQKEIEAHYRKVADIEAKMTKISEKIMQGAKSLNNKYNTIYAMNMELWFKVDSEVIENADSDFSSETKVRRSKTLTADEKKKLMEDAKLLDELEAKIQVFYDKVDKATEKLKKQIDREYISIDKIIEKNKAIWDKIAKKTEVK